MRKIITPIICIIIIAIIVFFGYRFFQKRNKDYELEVVESYNYYPVVQKQKYGVIDLQGNILIKPQYKKVIIPNPLKDVFICVKDDESKILFNQNGEQLFTNFEEVSEIMFSGTVSSMPYEKSVLSYKEDGKYGLIDYSGKKVTEPIYEEIGSVPYKEGEILVKKDGKYGVINNKGVILVEFEYDVIEGDGYYNEETRYKNSGYNVGNKTTEGYRYGYINNKFEKLLEVEYNEIYRITVEDGEKDTYLMAKKNGQIGVICNKKNIINCEYQNIEFDAKNKLFIVKKDTQYGIYDIKGKNIIPVEYDYILVQGNYIYAEVADEIKYFNISGEHIEELKFSSIVSTVNDKYYIAIDENGNYGVIDEKQKILVESTYSYIDYAFENYFIALRDGKLGIIDETNNILVEFKYDVLQCINGTQVIQGQISDIDTVDIYSKQIKKVASVENAVINVKKDYIEVYSEKSTKYFDFEGNEKTNTQVLKENELFAIEENGKWGMTDKYGNVVVECIYDKVTELNEYGFAGIKLDGKWGVIDKIGQVVLEPVYEHFAENEKPEFINKYYKVTYGYGEIYYTDEKQ